MNFLAWQVRRLSKKNNFITIAVVGSYGKTSTKKAIAQALSNNYSIRYQDGNYNDITSVPLIFFDTKMPSLRNPFSWIKLFYIHEKKLRQKYKFDIVVVELGTDGPGQIKKFSDYLKVDLAVITSIAPEHMESFSSLAEVMSEEISIRDFSKSTIANGNLCGNLSTEDHTIDIFHVIKNQPKDFWTIKIGNEEYPIKQRTASHAQMYSLASAFVVGIRLGIDKKTMEKNLEMVRSAKGRMNILPAIKNSLIIDDTYNASPDAMKLAIESFYEEKADYKIALLGNMNELGKDTERFHRDIGKLCNPKNLGLVVTLGPEANHFLADEAVKRGCLVIKTNSPYEAAEVIETNLKTNSIILAKGSQNNVFAEEAVKLLLKNPKDKSQLVRQSEDWIKKKRKTFAYVSR